MIVLDTNVLSELTRARPDPAVVAWLDARPAASVWTTAITLFELRYGLEIMPAGKRREDLAVALARATRDVVAGRVLDFDDRSATEAAAIAARLRAAGQPVDFRDVEIAGTVAAHGATLVTRNTRHFAATGILLVDPWVP